MNASTSKAKVEDEDYSTREDSSKDEDMRFLLDVTIDILKNGIEHLDKNLVKLKKPIPPRKWEDKKKKESQVTCYECGKL